MSDIFNDLNLAQTGNDSSVTYENKRQYHPLLSGLSSITCQFHLFAVQVH